MFGLPIHTVVYLTSPPEVVHNSRSESLPHRSHECTYPRSSYAFPSSRSGAWQCWRAASVHVVLTISAVGIQQPAPRVFRCCRGRRSSCFYVQSASFLVRGRNIGVEERWTRVSLRRGTKPRTLRKFAEVLPETSERRRCQPGVTCIESEETQLASIVL